MAQDNEKGTEIPAGPSVADTLIRGAFNPNIGILKRADNFMRTTANFATFGLADVAAGMLNRNLLRSSSCSTTLLCIDEELKRTNNVSKETPLEYAAGTAIGTMLNWRMTIKTMDLTVPVKEGIEHLISLQLLNQIVNHHIKPEFTPVITFDPQVPDSEITAPSVPNFVKEITGQKAPSSPRR